MDWNLNIELIIYLRKREIHPYDIYNTHICVLKFLRFSVIYIYTYIHISLLILYNYIKVSSPTLPWPQGQSLKHLLPSILKHWVDMIAQRGHYLSPRSHSNEGGQMEEKGPRCAGSPTGSRWSPEGPRPSYIRELFLAAGPVGALHLPHLPKLPHQ